MNYLYPQKSSSCYATRNFFLVLLFTLFLSSSLLKHIDYLLRILFRPQFLTRKEDARKRILSCVNIRNGTTPARICWEFFFLRSLNLSIFLNGRQKYLAFHWYFIHTEAAFKSPNLQIILATIRITVSSYLIILVAFWIVHSEVYTRVYIVQCFDLPMFYRCWPFKAEFSQYLLLCLTQKSSARCLHSVFTRFLWPSA